MSDFWPILLLLFAAVNPPAILATVTGSGHGRLQPKAALIAFLGAAVLLLAVTFAAGAFLDALELEPETFRISAGIVMMTTGVAFILFGPFPYPVEPGWKGALFPLAFPLLASPAAFSAVIASATDRDEIQTVAAALIVAAAVAAGVLALSGRATPVPAALARLIGAVLVWRAVGLLIEGIRAV